MGTIPEQVVVGPYRYSIVVDGPAIDAASTTSRVDLTGQCDRRDCRILIRPNMAADQEASTVLHEVLHAVTEFAGLDHRLRDDDEEDVVNSLAPILLDVLRRNPRLVEYLTA